jgi:hypothetical protein
MAGGPDTRALPLSLPQGEGTVLRAPGIIQASLLPWGERQDEG